MSKLVKFGMLPYRYDFSAETRMKQLGVKPDRFDAMTVTATDIPGADGSMPHSWHGRGQTSSREIRLRFRYTGDGTQSDVEAFGDELHAMKSWGYTRLFKQKPDGTLLWTWACCTNVSVGSDRDNLDYVWPTGEITFYCPTARWYTKAGMGFLDDGLFFDDDLTIPAPQIYQQTVDDGDTVQLTNNGNAPAGVFCWWEAPSGESVTNPQISRLSVDGVNDADRLRYVGTLSGGDVVIMDARNHLIQENYSTTGDLSKVDALRAVWFEIPPGTHDIHIAGTFTNGAILSLDLWDVYY
jgi:hypothetical protein